MKVPYNITDRTISFFAKGRPYSVSSESENFDRIRTALLGGIDTKLDPGIVEALIKLADQKAALTAGCEGVLSFNENEELVYGGRVLHNLWVDKIQKFRAAGEPFEPVFNALQDLMRNPTPQAIERLPIFLERVDSGFMSDGRCTAYKSVREDYLDHYTGTVSYKVGEKPSMDRSEVDPDPDHTCSRGLHVGSMEYIDSAYHAGRVVFVAFWPRDVVSVPVDYNGSKMRVCAMEVLDDVKPDVIQEFREKNRTVVTGYDYSDQGLEEEELAPKAKVGDWVELNDDVVLRVIRVDDDGDVYLKKRDGCTKLVYSDDYIVVVEAPPIWEQVCVGDKVGIAGHSYIKDGVYEVCEIESWNVEPDENGIVININDSEIAIRNDTVKTVKFAT